MVEPLMFFGLGVLAAGLLALVILPLVHARAARLTTRRLEASIPMSVAEIQANKDQLRAEFAVATRRLEMSLEQVKTKATLQLADLGKKTEEVGNLKLELADKVARIAELEARDKELQDEAQASEERTKAAAEVLRETEIKLTDTEAALAKANNDLADREQAIDSQRIELVAHQTQIGTLKDRVRSLDDDVRRLTEELSHQTAEKDARTQELAEVRNKLNDAIGEREKLRDELEAARQIEANLREELAAARHEYDLQASTLRAERVLAQSRLERTSEERTRLARELATLKRETEETRAIEREENAVINDRINDVAAQVAHLTTSLEGAGSPIQTILAADAIGKLGRNDGGHYGSGVDIPIRRVSLADRIRVLQNRPSPRV